MKKFLFVIPPFWGHINPTLSIGKTLLEKGYDVAWTSIIDIKESMLPKNGHYFYMQKSIEKNKKEIDAIIHLQNKGADMAALEAMRLGLRDTYIPLTRIMIDECNEIVNQYKPDVIINDCITFAGSLSAHLKEIPYATLTPITPNALHDTLVAPKVTEWIHQSIIDLQQAVGIEGEKEYIKSDRLNMYYTSQKFVGYSDEDCPPEMEFIGALTGRPDNTPFDWEKLKSFSCPKIYISIGTVIVNSRKDFFSKMVEAFKDKPVLVIAAADPSILDEWPDNFMVQGYVPQTELLKHVDVVIGHGGLNTVCDTYMNGIPMLIIPMAFDQSHTAMLIHDLKCGIRIKYSRLRISDLQNAIEELIYNPQYKEKAVEIQQSFIDAGGNERAAILLEQLL